MTKNTVIVVAGPTASGKTALGIALAGRYGSEIVSADSMQIYRRMDIGTAKATKEEQAQVRHHMIDVAEPEENYSVARYVDEASACCDRLLSEGRTPVLVGGTGLYIDSLLSGRDFSAREEDGTLRETLNRRYEEEGGNALLEELRNVDPERAAILHPSDRKRIVRALEVYRLTGETITEHDRKTRLIPPRYDAVFLIPGFRDRAILYERIDRRVDEMVRLGLFDEVRSLLAAGVPPEATSMQAIGYKEAVACLRGDLSEEETVALIKQASRRYAKRQLTWFGRRTDALRLYYDDPGGPEAVYEAAFKACFSAGVFGPAEQDGVLFEKQTNGDS